MSFVLAALLFVSASAAPKAAKAVAQGFEAHYRGVRSMAGYFLEKYATGSSGIVVESGTVYFEKPGRMRWDYDSPETKMYLDDGKNIWFYVPADHTASRTSVKESSDWRTPLALLAGKANLERLCGSLTLGSPAATGAKGGAASEVGDTVLVCGPRKADESIFQEVLLEVNSQNQLVRLDVRQPGDIEMDFHFGGWHENVPIEPARFRFEPPRGVAIVEDPQLGVKAQ
ncbi:MAG TPA: outer-membrane lipoprotein carrier protein LolA [Candidatus Acidoferrales bacterium]|nr:outer-membrane lipoprotein carrier protein LolA [Candidatus Acidoferrales bacterium]